MRLRTYVINLDKDVGRLAHMAKELGAAGIAFERFPAVYGLDVPADLAPFLLTPSGAIASQLKPGEIGCYASHLGVYQSLVADETADAALIFEDDCRLAPEFAQIVANALKMLPGDWDIVRLSNRPKRPYVSCGRLVGPFELAIYSRIPNIAAAYLISRAGAKRFLNMPIPRRRAVDEDLRRPWFHGLSTWGVVPPPAVSNLFESSIDALGDRGLVPGFRFSKILTKKREGPITAIRRLLWTINSLSVRGWLSCIKLDFANLSKPKLARDASDEDMMSRYRVAPLANAKPVIAPNVTKD
jgi:glycosyl transferase, family 25